MLKKRGKYEEENQTADKLLNKVMLPKEVCILWSYFPMS